MCACVHARAWLRVCVCVRVWHPIADLFLCWGVVKHSFIYLFIHLFIHVCIHLYIYLVYVYYLNESSHRQDNIPQPLLHQSWSTGWNKKSESRGKGRWGAIFFTDQYNIWVDGNTAYNSLIKSCQHLLTMDNEMPTNPGVK